MKWYLHVVKDNYANFKGRARRQELWMFVLFNLIFSIIAGSLDNVLGTTFEEGGGIIASVYALFILVPGLAVGARRLHDTGKTGWLLLLWLIPVIGWIVLLVFFVLDSKPGANKYGPNPKGMELA